MEILEKKMTLRAAVIGCGRMGQRHVEALMQLEQKTDVVGIADQIEDNLKQTIENLKLDKTQTFLDGFELIESLKPDLLVIATTAPSHHAFTIAAAKAGVPYILCEKPMAVSIEQAKEMIDVCKAHNARLAINHPVRFTEADIEIKNLMTSEKMGGLNAIHVSAGNFGLAMNVSHMLEMFRFISGDFPETVQAWFDKDIVPNPRGDQFEDRSGFLKIKTKSGKTLTVNSSAENGHGIVTSYVGKYGQIALNNLTGDALIAHRKEECRDRPTTLYGLPAENVTHKYQSSDLVVRARKTMEALLDGRGYPDGETILRTIEILVGAYVSNQENSRSVNVSGETLPENQVFPWA